MAKLSRLLEKSLPGVHETLRTARDKHALRQVLRKISDDKPVVRYGPFEGMLYPPQLIAGESLFAHNVVPKLIGSYETELHDALRSVFQRSYRQVINVGCAEGYYAVGLALRFPDIPVYAYDIDPKPRALCGETANLNGVANRVMLRAECEPSDLIDGSLVIIDCEGCELQLLNPELAPGLITSDVIVELHDCVDATISATVLDRFAASHDVHVLPKVNRDPSAYPALRGLPDLQQRIAMSEFRWGPLQWAFLSAPKVV
jgi:hypothetical protein